jgi:hypothetical protein
MQIFLLFQVFAFNADKKKSVKPDSEISNKCGEFLNSFGRPECF